MCSRLQKQIDKGALASERIFFNMGVLAMEDREHAKAEEYFKKAIQVFPMHYFTYYKWPKYHWRLKNAKKFFLYDTV